ERKKDRIPDEESGPFPLCGKHFTGTNGNIGRRCPSRTGSISRVTATVGREVPSIISGKPGNSGRSFTRQPQHFTQSRTLPRPPKGPAIDGWHFPLSDERQG